MVQMRKVIKELYPEQFGNGRKPAVAPKRRFLRRFADRRLRHLGTHFGTMNKKRLLCVTIVGLVAFKAWALVYYYNKFIVLETDVAAARSSINVQLQRRKDVVAALNTVVMAYAKHEKDIFEHAVDARKEIVRPAPGDPAKDAGSRLKIPGISSDPSLSKLLAVAEGFPALRLSETFQRLMDALVESETKVAEQRMRLNTAANVMGTALETFPAWVFNKMLRFKEPAFYEADGDVQEPVKLNLAPR